VRLRAQASMMSRPVCGEPVNPMRRMRGSAGIAAPASWPYPVTTLMTPAGIPASRASLASASGVSGASSAGFITMVFPAAIAAPTSVANIGPGAFQGMTPPTTPYGSRSVKPRDWGERVGSDTPCTLSACPAMKRSWLAMGGGPQLGRPTSCDSTLSSSALRSSTRSAQRKMRRARLDASRSRHAGKAFSAARIARSTSASSLRGTRAITSRLAGLMTSMVRPVTDATHSPPMSWTPSTMRSLVAPVADSVVMVMSCPSAVLSVRA